MSKKSKAASKQKNLQAKRARKQANRAMYQAWAAKGENAKSSRSRKGKKANQSTKGLHLVAHCGNIACRKCFTQDVKGNIYSITRNPKREAA